jgi:hypothetical protein
MAEELVERAGDWMKPESNIDGCLVLVADENRCADDLDPALSELAAAYGQNAIEALVSRPPATVFAQQLGDEPFERAEHVPDSS